MYEITIKEIKTVRKMVGKEWRIVDQCMDEEGRGPLHKYNYTPLVEKEIKIDEIIYNQRIENLDITALVTFINSDADKMQRLELEKLALESQLGAKISMTSTGEAMKERRETLKDLVTIAIADME